MPEIKKLKDSIHVKFDAFELMDLPSETTVEQYLYNEIKKSGIPVKGVEKSFKDHLCIRVKSGVVHLHRDNFHNCYIISWTNYD